MTPEFLTLAHALAEREMGRKVCIVLPDGVEHWICPAEVLWKLLREVEK